MFSPAAISVISDLFFLKLAAIKSLSFCHLPVSPEDFSAYRYQREFFLNCSDSLCVNISIHDDTILEFEETFYVSVELGTTALRTNISLNETKMYITIMDNDAGK